MFSPTQVKKLKDSWATVDRIDPTSKTYKKLDDMLENMSTEDLEKIAEAGIKFVSVSYTHLTLPTKRIV